MPLEENDKEEISMTKTVALDAGHGLKTAGKQTPDGVKEWSLNDKVRDKVVNILRDYDVNIINTDNDEGNTDESLSSRRSKYVNASVDAFVSIHHNALSGSWNNATGVEVFVDKNATNADMNLANLIYERLVSYTGLKARGIKRSNFTVIYQNSIPAVLCEGGFMDGTSDYKFITSDKGQTAYAKAVAEGLIAFLKLEKKNGASSTASTNAIASKKDESAYNMESFVRDIQSAFGAKVDGIAGPETLSKTLTLSSKKNAKHAAVKFVQKRLKELGYAEIGTIDGIAGPKFTSAVAAFQIDNGCVVDGEITAKNKTWKKLLGMS